MTVRASCAALGAGPLQLVVPSQQKASMAQTIDGWTPGGPTDHACVEVLQRFHSSLDAFRNQQWCVVPDCNSGHQLVVVGWSWCP